ncbi:MAG: hypothetical protein WCZ23_15490 [Rhodospirillaceae bacterium]
MDNNHQRTRNWTVIVTGVAIVALVAVVVIVGRGGSPTAPLQVSGGLPACESKEIEEGVADYIAAQNPATDVAIVSIQEFGRQQAQNGGPVVRRNCQVTLRTGDEYERVTLELAAEGGTDGAAWHLRLVELAEPPVAAPLEGVLPATPRVEDAAPQQATGQN